MIRLNLTGGLGNQMFEYAYARALGEKLGDKEIEINSWFNDIYSSVAGKKYLRMPNSLKHFQLNQNIREIPKWKGLLKGIFYMADFSIDVLRHRKKLMSVSEFQKRNRRGIYQVPVYAFTFFPCADKSKKNKRITGYFQNEKYFKDIKEILREEFLVKTQASEKNLEKIKELDCCNSVCVHIRRGDYLSSQYSFLNVCNEKYYQKGMDYIEERIKEPVFYIFSNNNEEINWIKKNYHFRQKVNYIELNNPDYEELRLMSHCKHFVMANSTFSWWGSYLAESTGGGKIVVVPSVWQREEYRGGEIDIYREDMIKIDVD